MSPMEGPIDEILRALQERAKELNCLYRVDEVLSAKRLIVDEAMAELTRVIPRGWQYPGSCVTKIVLDGRAFVSQGFQESPWVQHAPIVCEGSPIGEVSTYYTEPKPTADEGPFLKEERRLINAIAERIGYMVLQRRLRRASAIAERPAEGKDSASVILAFLRGSDRNLLRRITRRLINHLYWNGVHEAEELLQQFMTDSPQPDERHEDENRPLGRRELRDLDALAERTFRLAAEELDEEEMVQCLQAWIKEDRASFLFAVLEQLDTPLTELAVAVERFHGLGIDEEELPLASQTGMRVALLRRIFSEQLDFINGAKQVTRLQDFYELVRHIVFTPESHGKLGGKSAGLFVASRVVHSSDEGGSVLSDLRVPRTWYIPSDGLLQFLRFNNLEEVYDRKYREIDRIRQDYPYLIQTFKSSRLPADMVKGLAAALDDFEDRPIIVRSSSLLEDRVGSAFSGKYKSLFLGNQGTKRQRLAALQDAICEVYASVFGPDPIEYRAERNLLDVHEEMGIMIQEVVGTRVGHYFFPAFAGVAYSNNEFRWSHRIRRDDGLVRIVPGLGTRAVDRLSDDYPVLLAPGQPGLRVNATADEIVRYAPRKVDVLDLETNSFETIDAKELLLECGDAYPMIRSLVSQVDDGHVRRPTGPALDFDERDYVFTFEGLFEDKKFVTQVRELLRLLQERLGVAVDLEFASDGEHLYLLQCRAQGYGEESAPPPIPRDLAPEKVLFTANRYVSNARALNITHVVYVDYDAYQSLPDAASMRAVGTVIGRLNRLLPKRQFLLIGPGRWGSRGDIRLGVSVTYSQINNTAALIEMARKKGNYVPDLSFGTHFFQDLVEASIRYLPLYPDDVGVRFNEAFFRHATNVLPELVPDCGEVAQVVKVVDVPRQTDGRVVHLLMNADLDEAVAMIGEPASRADSGIVREPVIEYTTGDHWRWRLHMAERIASELDAERFGVKALYVIGSVKNATAGPGSDLDLVVHFTGNEHQRDELRVWFDGWSRCLSEMNYLRTGYRAPELLDVHFVSDEHVKRKTSFAAKIGAVTDAARELPLNRGASGDAESS